MNPRDWIYHAEEPPAQEISITTVALCNEIKVQKMYCQGKSKHNSAKKHLLHLKQPTTI